MTERVQKGGLQVARVIVDLLENDICPGTAIAPARFWAELESIIKDLGPVNQSLLKKRDQLQLQIDQWHKKHKNAHDPVKYREFLESIEYIVSEVDDFTITTTHVDPEIARLSGPQLVVPVMNARFALNAVNARWGSLYDALYGTDVIPHGDEDKSIGYNPVRGEKVIAYARQFLDEAAPLVKGSHVSAMFYEIKEQHLAITLADGTVTALAEPEKFVGYKGKTQFPEAVLLRNNGLHIELQINRQSTIGKADKAGVSDIVLEAALTTIMDCEDSVAAVDAEDKALVYKNWLGLMKGNLEASFAKQGRTLVRTMNPDRHYVSPDDKPLVLSGRSLMFVRNVGHLMTNNAVLDAEGNEIPEGILDGMFTALIARHDLEGQQANSKTGSVYIVKPKMHGPEEVAFTCQLFSRIENALNMPANTLKIGIMDEERRTSLNLKACISEARDRVVFINTGFLDRTGDEIHTSMAAGAVLPKADMKQTPWISAYEDRNVDIGLACGFSGRAQIGKGMWPMPDEMAAMMEAKIAHPLSGASTAWVPSPNAATLHAMHYHKVNVHAQQVILQEREQVRLDKLLTLPLLDDPATLTPEAIQHELDNNAQGILGYVVRWVEQGVGCSKVPDIKHTGLMEDRATLRISSQHIANWLHHGICSEQQVLETMKRMAVVVDQQNAGDLLYQNMAPDFDRSIAFKAACELVFKGGEQPNGYTEPVLHARRRACKEQ